MIFMFFLFSGVRLQNWSKLGLHLVIATVIVSAGTDSRSDVQNQRSEKPDPGGAPAPGTIGGGGGRVGMPATRRHKPPGLGLHNFEKNAVRNKGRTRAII